MKQRLKFINDYLQQDDTMAALCRRYGLQRSMGYQWVKRYRQEGLQGLEDRSRAPLDQAHRSSPQTVERVLEIRRDHPLWGAPKIRALLRDDEPQRKPPAASTIGAILGHEGLTKRGKKRRRTPPYKQPWAHADGSSSAKSWPESRSGSKPSTMGSIGCGSRRLHSAALMCAKIESRRCPPGGTTAPARPPPRPPPPPLPPNLTTS